jgi:hypothetical protein
MAVGIAKYPRFLNSNAKLNYFLVRASVVNKQNNTADARVLGALCVCGGPGLASCVH